MTTLRFSTIWDVSTARIRGDKTASTGERFLTIWDRPAPRLASGARHNRALRKLPKFYI
ncbi:hypothetical protein [Billgrantia saliphila]|uniref:hypothetical protein n=1 Tax=Billgrantia saliphila TaxID=1848458 RepID=UPI0012DE35D8|nr:hypothetical protein [Halomonas saliphila]